MKDRVADPRQRFHFVGVGGSGMSALAQYRAMSGASASGSDRSFDQSAPNEGGDERACLERLGVALHRQDGSGVPGAAVVVTSTAIEEQIPDVAKARELGLPVLHRAELLALHLDGPSLAVAGTSGKSTVTAMTFEILAHAGRDPSLITGGRLLRLMDRGFHGNAWRGAGPLVIEADESDGSLVQHAPQVGVLLNLHRDHMEPERVAEQFRVFRGHVRGAFVVADEPELREFRDGSLVFGFGPDADVRGRDLEVGRAGSRFTIDGVAFEIAMPGAHNAWNALAAAAAARTFDVPYSAAASALRDYRGVHRRYEIAGTPRGIEVVDDFAHNPKKIAAALEAARLRGNRVLAWFQPHGFAPMRFLRNDLVRMIADEVRPIDRFAIAPIFFAGGTVAKDIASEDLVADVRKIGGNAENAPTRDSWIETLRRDAREGDVAMILGARDPSLPRFAREVAQALQ